MSEIAAASGYGSVRRFNETFQALFNRPPVNLRKISDDAQRSSIMTVTQSYFPPYDWNSMLALLTQHAIPSVEAITACSYQRTFNIRGVVGMIDVCPAQTNAVSASAWKQRTCRF